MSRSSQRRAPRLASLVIAAIAAGSGGAHIHAADRADDQRSNTQATARADDRSDKVCQRVRPVGSNIPTTICRTRQQMADEQAAAREAVNENRVR